MGEIENDRDRKKWIGWISNDTESCYFRCTLPLIG